MQFTSIHGVFIHFHHRKKQSNCREDFAESPEIFAINLCNALCCSSPTNSAYCGDSAHSRMFTLEHRFRYISCIAHSRCHKVSRIWRRSQTRNATWNMLQVSVAAKAIYSPLTAEQLVAMDGENCQIVQNERNKISKWPIQYWWPRRQLKQFLAAGRRPYTHSTKLYLQSHCLFIVEFVQNCEQLECAGSIKWEWRADQCSSRTRSSTFPIVYARFGGEAEEFVDNKRSLTQNFVWRDVMLCARWLRNQTLPPKRSTRGAVTQPKKYPHSNHSQLSLIIKQLHSCHQFSQACVDTRLVEY